ncbi:hypothetical protein [Paraburkholderia adhaesiva]|uniref:hypothetical protein n=1 Tax=Paraburkholderia adhaesiva TaxID=2883244 RepID=UPI001F259C2F|nr:hypothetical protein [Paraburkholderia adhaesiva]
MKPPIHDQNRACEQPGRDRNSGRREDDDAVYLELQGFEAEVAMARNLEHPRGNVLRLSVTTARQRGLVAPDPKRGRWSKE